MEEESQSQLIVRLVDNENHCYTTAKTKIKKIDEDLQKLPSVAEADLRQIKEVFRKAHDKLSSMEKDISKELKTELLTKEEKLNTERRQINNELNTFLKVVYTAKINMIDDASSGDNCSTNLKQLIPFLKDCSKSHEKIRLPRFIPDTTQLETLSLGYVNSTDIDSKHFCFVMDTKFNVGSMSQIIVKSSIDVLLDSYQHYFTWSVYCEGQRVETEGFIANNMFWLKFWIAKEAVHEISFKVCNQHIRGSPLIIQSSQYSTSTYTPVCKSSGEENESGFLSSKQAALEISPAPLRRPRRRTSDLDSGFASTASLSPSSEERKNLMTSDKPEISAASFKSNALKHRLSRPLTVHKPRTQSERHLFNGTTTKSTNHLKDSTGPGVSIKNKESLHEEDLDRCNKQLQELALTNSSSTEPKCLRRSDSMQNRMSSLSVPIKAEQKALVNAKNQGTVQKMDWAPDDNSLKVAPWSPSKASEQLVKNVAAKYVFTIKSSGQSGFRYPIGVAELSNSQIVIADTFNDRLLMFEADGAFLREVVINKSRLHRPSAICVLPNDDFAVRDDNAIWVFGLDGTHRNTFGESYLRRNFGLAIDSNGFLLTVEEEKGHLVVVVIDSTNGALLHRVNVYDQSGLSRLAVSKPRFITFRPPSDLLVVDLAKDTVYIIDMNSGFLISQFGQSGDRPGQFHDPSGIVCDGDGFIIVGDSRNHRIQVFSPLGDFLSVLPVDRPLQRPSGFWLNTKGFLFVLNYWEQSLVKYKLCPKNQKRLD